MKRYLVAALMTVMLNTSPLQAVAADQMDVTRLDALYLDRFISLTIEWQSVNPVLKVMISAGRETREVPVDEFDNRRNPNGYQGAVTVQLPAEPHYPQTGVPYQIQLEDDLRQKSAVFSGRVPVTAAQAQNLPQREDTWGQANIKTNPVQPLQRGGNPGDMVDKLLVVIDRFDLAPSMDVVKVNVLSSDNVSFSSKASDDKGLLEVRIRVYDGQGNLVGFQSISNLGKVWQGSSQTFTLGGGSFRVVEQAIDSVGNTSKEQQKAFTLSGPPRALALVMETPLLQTVQPSSQTPSTYQLGTPSYLDQPLMPQVPSIYPDQPPLPTTPYQQPPPVYQTQPVPPPPLPLPQMQNDPGFGVPGQQPAR